MIQITNKLKRIQVELANLLGIAWNLCSHNKFVTNASIYVIGTMLQKAAGFLLIPLYTRYLTPADYGIVGLAIAVEGAFSLLIGLGLSSAIVRFYYDYREKTDELRSYITTNFLFLSITAVGITLGLSQWGELIWIRLSSGQVAFSPYISLALWLACSNALVQIPLMLYRTAQKAAVFVVAQLAIFLTSVGAIIVFVVGRHMGAEGQLLGSLIASLTTMIVLVALMMREYFSWHIDWMHLRSALIYSLPLVPHVLAGWALNAVDRVLLESSGMPLQELGLYNLGHQLGMVIGILVYSINQAWMPYYFDLMKREIFPEVRVRQVVFLYMIGIGGICLLSTLFSAEIVRWIAPQQYLGTEKYMPPTLLAYLCQGLYFFASAPLFYHKRTRIIPVITLISAAVNIGLNLWWIPLWGAMGSAWATTISFAVLSVLAFVVGQWLQFTNFFSIKLAPLFGVVLACVIFVSAVTNKLIYLSDGLVGIIKISFVVIYIGVTLWLIRPIVLLASFRRIR